MEGLVSHAVALDISPLALLRSLRGKIRSARLAYPDVLHLEVVDGSGESWRFATQDADWTPHDPSELQDQEVLDVEIDEGSGALHFNLKSGSSIDVKPAANQSVDDPPSWELFAPNGLVLEFGPGVNWQIGPASTRAS